MDDAKTYESYRQAFDERMANLSPDDLNTIKNVASLVGSVVGSIYGQRLASKVTGNSRLGRAIGETAGSLVGSLVGSEAGTNLVSSIHESSVERVAYEEARKVAAERGEPIPERRRRDHDGGETRSRGNNNYSGNHRYSGREDNENNGNNWVDTGLEILGVMASINAARRHS